MPASAPSPPADIEQPVAPVAPEPEGGLEEDEAILDELLVEDVSIDGMCGVY